MLIFSRRKKIVVDAFTDHPGAFEFFPIQKAAKFLPEWWKRLPSNREANFGPGLDVKVTTIKRCEGIIGQYKSGFIIPLWAELALAVDGEGGYSFLWSNPWTKNDSITQHTQGDFAGYSPGHIHIKIASPWLLQEKTGVQFMWTQPSWNLIDNLFNFNVLPGVLEYKQNRATHINMYLKDQKARFNLQAGTPLAHVIPMSDKDVEIRPQLLNELDFEVIRKRSGFIASFYGNHRRLRKIGNA
jgi:hypothetical protein